MASEPFMIELITPLLSCQSVLTLIKSSANSTTALFSRESKNREPNHIQHPRAESGFVSGFPVNPGPGWMAH
jgi:hypothetical protein